ncbi:hypothetical protein ISE1_0592 [plant metagenome]|uniref:Uncharacterized protein n=1 Tax=plant metagenome TaxID=1297885 RepID=A0A484V011_9ZZZZ
MRRTTILTRPGMTAVRVGSRKPPCGARPAPARGMEKRPLARPFFRTADGISAC